MKTPLSRPLTRSHCLRLLCLFAAIPLLSSLQAADDKLIAAVRAADDARIAATTSANREALEAIYSDELHYGHSNAKVDNKASQIQAVLAGPNKYDRFEHKERTFTPAGPGIVLMQGRVLVQMTNKQTAQKSALDLNYLAVWREENGKWRFLAWQSCRHPDPAAAAAKK